MRGEIQGSCSVEIETQLMIAHTLGYLPEKQTQILLNEAAELGRILNGLIKSLKEAA